MSMLSTLAVTLGRILTYVQLILYLPLALDLAGQDCFNALSASLACYYFLLSTIRLLTKNTKWSWLGSFLSIFQFIVVPACLLISFNFYSPPENSYFAGYRSSNNHNENDFIGSGSGSSASKKIENAGSMAISLFRPKSNSNSNNNQVSGSGNYQNYDYSDYQYTNNQTFNWLVFYISTFFWWSFTRIPTWWSTLLRISSPIFSLLEGVSTLLVIQSLGSSSRWIIARSLSSPPPPPNKRRLLSYFPSFGLGGAEGWQLLFLVLSAFVYVFSALALYLSFEGATKGSAGIAAAVGVSISSTFWLTAIAFGVRKGNVVETSLMLAYVVFNVCTLDSITFPTLEDPITLIKSFKVESFSTSSINSNANLLMILKSSKFFSPFFIDSITSLIKIIKLVLGQSLDFIRAAGSALPKSVLVSLVYRMSILYASSRILPGLKKEVENSNGNGRDGSLSRNGSQVNLKLNSNEKSTVDDDKGLKDEEIKGEIEMDEIDGKINEIKLRESLEESEDESETETESESSSDDDDDDSESDSDSEETTKRIKSKSKSKNRKSKNQRRKERKRKNSRKNRRRSRRRNQKYSDSESDSEDSSSNSTSTDSSTTTTSSTSSSSTESDFTKSERRKKWRRESLLKSKKKLNSKDKKKGGGSGKTLREEESFGTFISIIVSYSRLILIAVYSHLLMLDQSHKVYWRFLTIALTLTIWSMELILGREDSEFFK